MLGLTNIGGGGAAAGHIKSIQRVVRNGLGTAKTADLTISAVNTAKSVLLVGFRGNSGTGSTQVQNITYTAEFINSTTVRLTREGTNNITITLECTVIEFEDAVFVESGSATATGYTNISSTITLSKTVNPAKVLCFYNFRKGTTAEYSHFDAIIHAWLASSTTVTIYYMGTGDLRVLNWYVVELP